MTRRRTLRPGRLTSRETPNYLYWLGHAELMPGSAPATQPLEHLAGRVSQYTGYYLSACYPNLSRGHVEWSVGAPDGATFELFFQAEKAGICRTAVTTGE